MKYFLLILTIAFSLNSKAYSEFSEESKLIEAGMTSTSNQFGDKFASLYVRYDGPLINCELPVGWNELEAIIVFVSEGKTLSKKVRMQVNCSFDGPPTHAIYFENCYLDSNGLCPRDALFNEWLLASKESKSFPIELAFVDGQGNWDSLWGRNYNVNLQARRN